MVQMIGLSDDVLNIWVLHLQEIMRDPVILEDGSTYERSSIQQWFQQGSKYLAADGRGGGRHQASDSKPRVAGRRGTVPPLHGAHIGEERVMWAAEFAVKQCSCTNVLYANLQGENRL